MVEKENKPPVLIELYFGDTAELAWKTASAQLQRWAMAFECWLDERRKKYRPTNVRQTCENFQRLIRYNPKMLWELQPSDLTAFISWMHAQGYAKQTIAHSISNFNHFFKWLRLNDSHPLAGLDIPNPALGLPRPKTRPYENSRLLSREEAARSLWLISQDPSPVGRRDYAFFLARLTTGVSNTALLTLTWGDLPHPPQVELPEPVHQAINAYLQASGRLPSITPASYIFAPLKYPFKEQAGFHPEDWADDRHVTLNTLLHNLKLYGKAAGIPPDRLIIKALRNTARRSKMDELYQRASLAENPDLQSAFLMSPQTAQGLAGFMSTSPAQAFKVYHLAQLPGLPPDPPPETVPSEMSLPDRNVHRLPPGYGATHGFFAHSHPAEAIQAVLAEDIQGVEEQVVGLRLLERKLVDLYVEARGQEATQMGEAIMLVNTRLAEVIKFEQKYAKEAGDEYVAGMLKLMNSLLKEGEPPITRQDLLDEALGQRGDLEQALATRRLNEEIAATRYVLRKTLQVALESTAEGQVVRLAGVYALGCYRLMQMLLRARGDEGVVKDYLEREVQQAREEVLKAYGYPDLDALPDELE